MWICAALRSGALCHSVSIPEEDVETEEIFSNSWVERRRAEDEETALVEAEGLFDAIVDQFFRDFELEACLLSSFLFHCPLLTYALRPSTCIANLLPILARMPVFALATYIILS